MLQEIFKVPGYKIDLVPHGVPDLPFLDPNFYKDRFGVEGKAVLLTFGLLSPNKGIENVIHALPQILSKHKNVAYIVAGGTLLTSCVGRGRNIEPVMGADGNMINIYYGAADCSIALAHASVRSLLEWLDANGSFERRQRAEDL